MTHDVVRETHAMLSGMQPVLKPGRYFFCTTNDPTVSLVLLNRGVAMFNEDEGTSFVLTEEDAARHDFDQSMPMSQIVLKVFSALDGVGLTASVATALADDGIPCNMIAAYHHDNVFVPEPMARRALAVLADVQRRASSPETRGAPAS